MQLGGTFVSEPTTEDIRAAISAAFLAHEIAFAQALAKQYGLSGCLCCGDTTRAVAFVLQMVTETMHRYLLCGDCYVEHGGYVLRSNGA